MEQLQDHNDQIVKEKENYISKLEKELNDMGKENDKLKDYVFVKK